MNWKVIVLYAIYVSVVVNCQSVRKRFYMYRRSDKVILLLVLLALYVDKKEEVL